MMLPGTRVRPPVTDGLFYPEDPAGVLAFMREVRLGRGQGGRARAVFAPHGAWELSGSVAAAAFAAAAGRAGTESPARVVVMGPIHGNRGEGVFLSDSDSFRTPLGDIPVDAEASRWLESHSPLIEMFDIPHLYEHSLEVILPFVKFLFPRASLVPVLLGGWQERHVHLLADALRAVFAPVLHETLFAVSLNMAAAGTAALRDCARLFREGNEDALREAFRDGLIPGCGTAPAAALLRSGLLDGLRLRTEKRPREGMAGDKGETVFYGAFSFE